MTFSYSYVFLIVMSNFLVYWKLFNINWLNHVKRLSWLNYIEEIIYENVLEGNNYFQFRKLDKAPLCWWYNMNWFSRVKRLLPSGNSHTWEKTLLTLRIAQEKSHMRKDLFGSVPVRKNIIRMKSIMKTKIGMVHRIRLCESLNSLLSSILREI